MPGRGFPPEPAALRALKGKPIDNCILPSAERIVRPTNLTPGAVAVWDRLAADMERKGVLTFWDIDALAAYCDAVDRRDTAAAHLDEEGETVETARHGRIVSPWFKIWESACTQMLRYSQRLGLTPADRVGLKVRNAKPESRGQDLLTG